MLAAYGPQHWWPADTKFEIAVGAILVQRTSWRNADLALAKLRECSMLEPEAIARAGRAQLMPLIRTAGFANAKTDYLLSLARFFLEHGGSEELARQSTAQLRQSLLTVRGVGPETADAILLYLFERPVWVADQYANRLFERIYGSRFDHAQQKKIVEHWTGAARTTDLQELHALIVAHGQRHCRSIPVCQGCPLQVNCRYGRDGGDAARAGSQ